MATKKTKNVKNAPALRNAEPYINSAGVKLPNADIIIEADADGTVTSCRDAVTGTEYVGGGGGGGLESIYEAEFDVNTTSSTEERVFIDNSTFTVEKGVFYLWVISDANPVSAGVNKKYVCSYGLACIGTTSYLATITAVNAFILQVSGNLTTYTPTDMTDTYGIYVKDFQASLISVSARYRFGSTGDINSHYKLEVFKVLDARELIA